MSETSPRLIQLKAFLEESPNDSFILFAIAKEYEGLGVDALALEYYLKIVAVEPDYVGTYYHLAKLYEHLEERDLALQTYEKGMTVARKMGDHHALSELSGAKLNLDFED